MYKKIIKSGNLIEVFEYEKAPPEFRRRRKARQKNPRRHTRNVSRARLAFFRLVRANLGPSRRPALCTLTMRDIVGIKEGWRVYRLFANRWKIKRKRLQKSNLDIVAVPEFQERGAVHFHLLIWGLSDEEIISERSSRRIAKEWGYGFVDVRPSDGSARIATYLAKYMWKGMYDVRLLGAKSYSASRGLVRSVSFRTALSVDLLQAELDGHRIETNGEISKGVDNPLTPKQEREYDTRWLGKCNYKLYETDI